MVFEYDFEGEKFLIELIEFYGGKDKVEIFSIKYSDDRDDSDDYEIKMFRVEGDKLINIKVTDQPKKFLDLMAEDLQNVMPKSFYANPYFDELIIFFGNTVLTSKDRFIPHSCTLPDRKELYEKKGKENKSDYIEYIKTKLSTNPNPAWPFKGRLHIQFSVSDKLERLNRIDLDNLAKAILDSLQGLVFENDAQIDALVATKDFTQGMVGNLIAIKELGPSERPKFQDFLFSGKSKTYRNQAKQKQAEGKLTRFVRF